MFLKVVCSMHSVSPPQQFLSFLSNWVEGKRSGKAQHFGIPTAFNAPNPDAVSETASAGRTESPPPGDARRSGRSCRRAQPCCRRDPRAAACRNCARLRAAQRLPVAALRTGRRSTGRAGCATGSSGPPARQRRSLPAPSGAASARRPSGPAATAP